MCWLVLPSPLTSSVLVALSWERPGPSLCRMSDFVSTGRPASECKSHSSGLITEPSRQSPEACQSWAQKVFGRRKQRCKDLHGEGCTAGSGNFNLRERGPAFLKDFSHRSSCQDTFLSPHPHLCQASANRGFGLKYINVLGLEKACQELPPPVCGRLSGASVPQLSLRSLS